MVTSKATGAVVSGAHLTSLSGEDVNRLGEAIRLSGLSDVSLDGRLSVVFVYPGMGVGDVYPEMAGCTSEVCAFIEESVVFEKHGIQVIGLSTEASEPPSGCLAIPFATGLIPQHGVGSPLDFVEKAERRYAVRASFVVGPDGTGEKITDIKDVVSHVRRCFRLAMDRRLARYRDAAMEYLSSGGNGIQPNVTLRGLLPNGADSVAIPRLDVTLELVAKLADGAIISQEAGYIRRINRLLVDHGRSELFPTVLAICDTEDPAWYLMEAVDPTKLDEIVFADQARTILSDTGKTAIESAVDKLIVLYQLTMSPETPAVARYHYLERFLQLPQRDDFRSAFALLVGGDMGVLEEHFAAVDVDIGVFEDKMSRPQRLYFRSPQFNACLIRIDDMVVMIGAFILGYKVFVHRIAFLARIIRATPVLVKQAMYPGDRFVCILADWGVRLI